MNSVLRVWLLILTTGIIAACASPPHKEDREHVKRAAKINVQLGVGYLREGNLEVAQTKLERALKQDPKLSSAHWTYALLQMRLGENALAEKHFRKAISLDPKDSRARNNYGTFLCGQGRLEDAEKQFLKAVENPLYREPASAYTNAALCSLKIPDKQKAKRYFRDALEKDPTYAPALFNLAKLSFEDGQHLQARAFMQRYAEAAEHNSKTLWLSYRIERQLGNPDLANEFAARLKDRFPDSRETTLLLAREPNGS